MSENKNKKLLIFLTPVIVLLLCVGIIIVAAIKPYNKLSVYLNLAFMDDFKTNPDDDSSGLVIVEGDIQLDYSGETSSEVEVTVPLFGEQFAVLRSSGFDLSVPVYWGSTDELLKRGACQATYSKLPGIVGNAVISAHEDTFFAELNKLQEGDTVTINTNYGEFTYTVTELISFTKTQKKYVNQTDDERLTLYTCKKDILGASDERIGVVCEITEKKFYVQAEEETEN
ncbi:MAG: class D sortase [Ruminococcus sp.]|nr:class D sortase [Ruminococcus sp.]